LTSPDEIRTTVKSIIASIKPFAEGFTDIRDDDPLFRDGSGRASPVNLDSLDALDLAMTIGEHFKLDSEEFERLVESEDGLGRLRTVNDITALILSLTEGDQPVARLANLQGKEVNA